MSAADPARDTIFALSSGALPAAIAIVRVSGPLAGEALRMLAGRLPAPRMAVMASLRRDGALLDQALVLWLPGPHNATGEDMAELHLHGGRAVVASLLDTLGALPGVRAAAAGEFTRRAFANGRMDLAQAEGLADLLAAETEAQRRQALRLVEGGLGRLIEQWRSRLLALAAHVEAAIEFGEDEEDVPPLGEAQRAELVSLIASIEQVLSHPPAERLRDGLRVVLAGPVNSGKSTLINALAGREVAIATPVAGTTRDLIEAPISLGGFPLILIDSAGLRDSDDPIEQIGVRRAEDAIAGSDILLWLGMPDQRPDHPNALVLHPRCDLPNRHDRPAGADIAVSGTTGAGMGALRTALIDRARAVSPSENAVALNERQRGLVDEGRRSLSAALQQDDVVALAEELRIARSAFDQITGRSGVEDMLDSLFGRFCIGK